MGTYAIDLQTLSIGLLLPRVVIGFIMAAHGAQKLSPKLVEAKSADRH